jgi:deazaflavin-dependent oxidoreductase (nitroreductase family)
MTESARKGGPPKWVIHATAPVARAISGRRWFPLFAIIHHHGRRSGTAYSTPIAVVPTQSTEIFLIGLPWGAKTDWARNVLAAGSATLTWRGLAHVATEPRLVDGMEAATLAKPFFRPIVGRFPAAIVLRRS